MHWPPSAPVNPGKHLQLVKDFEFRGAEEFAGHF
jgi:hypothetical protein